MCNYFKYTTQKGIGASFGGYKKKVKGGWVKIILIRFWAFFYLGV